MNNPASSSASVPPTIDIIVPLFTTLGIAEVSVIVDPTDKLVTEPVSVVISVVTVSVPAVAAVLSEVVVYKMEFEPVKTDPAGIVAAPLKIKVAEPGPADAAGFL
jgi:hypothetical protein